MKEHQNYQCPDPSQDELWDSAANAVVRAKANLGELPLIERNEDIVDKAVAQIPDTPGELPMFQLAKYKKLAIKLLTPILTQVEFLVDKLARHHLGQPNLLAKNLQQNQNQV